MEMKQGFTEVVALSETWKLADSFELGRREDNLNPEMFKVSFTKA